VWEISVWKKGAGLGRPRVKGRRLVLGSNKAGKVRGRRRDGQKISERVQTGAKGWSEEETWSLCSASVRCSISGKGWGEVTIQFNAFGSISQTEVGAVGLEQQFKKVSCMHDFFTQCMLHVIVGKYRKLTRTVEVPDHLVHAWEIMMRSPANWGD